MSRSGADGSGTWQRRNGHKRKRNGPIVKSRRTRKSFRVGKAGPFFIAAWQSDFADARRSDGLISRHTRRFLPLTAGAWPDAGNYESCDSCANSCALAPPEESRRPHNDHKACRRDYAKALAPAMSESGTFRTWRDVRLESAMRCTADINRTLCASSLCIFE